MSVNLKKILWGPWDKARGPLTEDLKTIETVLNRFFSTLAPGGTLSPFSIAGDPTPATRYVANTGPQNQPTWDLVDLANGVKSFLDLSHLGPASTESLLVGRSSIAPSGPFQEITLDPSLTMTGTVLSVSAGAVTDSSVIAWLGL